jgi:phage shock protein A
MSQQGFFARLSNLWSGFIGLWIGRREASNPEAVYEAAIAERIQQYYGLTKAVAGVVALRNKLAQELEGKSRELKEIKEQIAVALDRNEDEVALILIQRKEELEKDIVRVQSDLQKSQEEAEEAKRSMIQFQGQIEELKREKETMLARLATARARHAIQQQLDSLSPEADVRALESVRDHINRLNAEVDVAREVSDQSLTEKIRKIRSDTANASARAQLEELKKARQAQREAQKVEKTI